MMYESTYTAEEVFENREEPQEYRGRVVLDYDEFTDDEQENNDEHEGAPVATLPNMPTGAAPCQDKRHTDHGVDKNIDSRNVLPTRTTSGGLRPSVLNYTVKQAVREFGEEAA